MMTKELLVRFCVVFGVTCVFQQSKAANSNHFQVAKDVDTKTFDFLRDVVQDTELSKPESLKNIKSIGSNFHIIKDQKINANPSVNQNSKKKSRKKNKNNRFRTDLLRQELAKESQDNCLAKLLCGGNNNNAVASSSSSTTTQSQKTQNSYFNGDYALILKNFLDIFLDDPGEEAREQAKEKAQNQKKKPEQDAEEEDEDDDSGEDDGDGARIGENFVNITGSVAPADEEVITSTSTTVSSVTTGATITELPTDKQMLEEGELHQVTLEELLGHDRTNSSRKSNSNSRLRKVDGVRQPRGQRQRWRTPKLSFERLQDSEYIENKMHQLKSARSESEKLNIARKIASKLRQPRQCKEFSSVAAEILQTCPLTTEVIRYFNSNLKNGTQLALLKKNEIATEGGLVVLNDRGGVPHPYFLDNSPIVANTVVNKDLKNPTVPGRYTNEEVGNPLYETTSPQKLDVFAVDLSKTKKDFETKKKKKKEANKDDDGDESDENEEDEEEGEEDEQSDEDEEEEEDEEDKGRIEITVAKYRNQQEKKRQRISSPANQNKPSSPRPRFPPGTIKVYGVPRPSFDTDFFQISNQIGNKKVVLYDQDDFHETIPHVVPPKSKVKSKHHKRGRRKPTPTRVPDSAGSDSDEQEEDEEEERFSYRPSYNNNRHMSHPANREPTRRERRPHSFSSLPYYGSYPAPRPEEYYQNGKPRRPLPPTPSEMSMPMVYKPRHEIKRLNFIHTPGSSLLRPPRYPNLPNYPAYHY